MLIYFETPYLKEINNAIKIIIILLRTLISASIINLLR